ncbi:MAG: MBL fold metallo-hydrolase [Acidimicrobiia bacterium]
MPRQLLTTPVDKLPDDVLHAALPTPFPVGPVNCYLLAAEPVTLVDPGMVFPDSLAALEALLASAGLRVADVEVVLVTHGHPDHYGAAGWVAERSAARVVCGAAERVKVLGRKIPGYMPLLAGLGMPADLIERFPTLRESTVDHIVYPTPEALTSCGDGDVLAAGGRDWTVVETPGHAAGHLSLWDPGARVLLSGDHLLPHITPNPALEADDAPGGRRRSLIEYLDSLPRFAALDPAVVLPGHGPAFTDVDQLIANLRRHHEERSVKVAALVAEMGSPTPYDVAMRLFPTLTGFSVMLGVSEAVGHLDLLVAEGRLRQVDEHPFRFAANGVA